MPEEKIGWPISVDLPNGTRKFETPGELEEFLNQEVEKCEWLKPAIHPRDTIANSYFQLIERPRELLQEWRNSGPSEKQRVAGRIQAFIQEKMGGARPQFVLSSSPIASLVEDIRRKFGDHIAAGVLMAMCDYADREKVVEQSMKIGAALVAMHRAGWNAENMGRVFDEVYQACVKQLSEIARHHADSIQTQNEQTAAHRKVFDALAKSGIEEIEDWRKAANESSEAEVTRIRKMMDQEHNKQAAQHAEIVDATTKRLELLESRYKEIMAIQEPANYWATKRDEHRMSARNWSITAGISGVISVALIYASTASASEAFLELKDPTAWAFVAAKLPPIVLAVGLFWLMRILVRGFLSHYHLSIDADERVVLAKTYLALQAKDADMTAEDRRILLEQLLRHSPSGLNDGDSAPQISIGKIS